MKTTRDFSFPVIDSILHPTDFSDESLVAFHHALRAAVTARAKLVLLHVSTGHHGEHRKFPEVRETLERWGLLESGSPRSAVADLGIEVRKVVTEKSNPVHSVLDYLNRHPADLIVLATHRHEGRLAWLRHSVAEPVARKSGQMTLFLPEGAGGFVSPDDGAVALRNILIPIAHSPDPQPAVEAAARLARRLNCAEGNFVLLHVAGSEPPPKVSCPEVAGWNWETVIREGGVVDCIVDTARERGADLVVMTTAGRRGFLDVLQGSHSERVLHQVPAPLLAVPAGSTVARSLEMDIL